MNRTVAAILLAAGKSRRMGSCKQLLPLDGKAIIRRCLETLSDSGIADIVVVISEEGQSVAEAVHGYPARVVINSESNGDMASSILTGRDNITATATGVVISLCDYPLVSSTTVAGQINRHRSEPDRIIIPCFEGKRGHPLLFPKVLLDELSTGMILRDLVRANQRRVCHFETADPGILIDMDTPEDYRRICSMI